MRKVVAEVRLNQHGYEEKLSSKPVQNYEHQSGLGWSPGTSFAATLQASSVGPGVRKTPTAAAHCRGVGWVHRNPLLALRYNRFREDAQTLPPL